MEQLSFHSLLIYIQHAISFCGVFIIFIGVLAAFIRYLAHVFPYPQTATIDINQIRLKLSKVLTLGLEFIIAADLIGTTTAPDYYSIGILASIVLIRTLLSYTLNREISNLSQQEAQNSTI